jgi:capsular polysaccharide biosynthesis protein
MLYRLNPLVSRLRPRLGKTNDYRLTSRRSWTIAPAVTHQSPRAMFDDSEIGRIKGVFEGNTLDQEMDRAIGGPVTHGATTVHEFHDALLSRGHLFTTRASLSIGGAKAPIVALGKLARHENGVLVSTTGGVKYFGHWMLDDLPLMMAAEELGSPVSVLTDLSSHQNQYLEMFGLAPPVIPDAFFKRLLVIDDFGQNDYKLRRYLALRALAARHAQPKRPPGVMLLRGTTGMRRVLVNEQEVANLVRARGWMVIDPVTTSTSDILDACMDVPMILGVEGSQLCNGLMWMSRQGTVVVIQPPQRFTTVLKTVCDCLGMDYAFVVADAQEAGSFRVDLYALQRMLDRVTSHLACEARLS